MGHLVLLLYILSGFSGAAVLIYLEITYARAAEYMRAYRRLHICYTLLMGASLVILYLRVNVFRDPELMRWFVALVLLGLAGLAWTLPRFTYTANGEVLSPRARRVWTAIPLVYAAAAYLLILVSEPLAGVAAALAGAAGFIVISLWMGRRFRKENEIRTPRGRSVWKLFLILAPVLAGAELGLKALSGFSDDYTVTLPVIFLLWNGLMIRQFRIYPPPPYGLPGEEAPGSLPAEDQTDLTPREKEIIRAIVRGDSNKEIAAALAISFSTVKNHIYNIFRKTGARSRVDLVNRFRNL